jgi:hypothetical protein
MAVLESTLQHDVRFERRRDHWLGRLELLREQARELRLGGGEERQRRHRARGKMTARERIEVLCDPGEEFFEFGLWTAWGCYGDYGGAPAAGVVVGIGKIHGRDVVVVANDATVTRTACRSSIWSTRPGSSCLSRTRSSRIASTSGAPSTTTLACRPRASSRWRRSWAPASPAAPTCRS